MEQDKLRAEFEAWHRDRYPAVDVRRQNLIGTYTLLIVEQRWEVWHASREAVVVVLPVTHLTGAIGIATRQAFEKCRRAIHAAGIRTR